MTYDQKYFEDRGLENKHYTLVLQWLNTLDLPPGSTVLDYGCGKGPYTEVMKYFGMDCYGYDPNVEEFKDDSVLLKDYDLVLCIDVLEHLPEKDIKETLRLIADKPNSLVSQEPGKAIFSICFAGDPNFERDETHITFKSKLWWVDKITQAGFKVLETPSKWWYKHQFLLCEVEG